MKQDKKTTNKSGCTAVLAAAMIAAGGFSALMRAIRGRMAVNGKGHRESEMGVAEWRDEFYGNGSIFFRAAPRDQRSEYYLKEAVRYPGKQIRGGIRRENRKQIIAGLRSKNCKLSNSLTGFIWMKNASSVCA